MRIQFRRNLLSDPDTVKRWLAPEQKKIDEHYQWVEDKRANAAPHIGLTGATPPRFKGKTEPDLYGFDRFP